MLSSTVEDYLKAIYWLQERNEKATTKQIARKLDVTMPSVTSMMKTLVSEALITRVPYQGVALTGRGREHVLALLRRHRLIECFLYQTLGVPWEQVHGYAEKLEHVIDEPLIERIDALLGRPNTDPHGQPIPLAEHSGAMPSASGVPLIEAPERASVRLVEVPDDDPAFLSYLSEQRLRIGDVVQIERRVPAGGLVILRKGRRKIALGREVAAEARVQIIATNQSAEP